MKLSPKLRELKSFGLALFSKAGEDNLPRLSSSFAFFALLSLAPFLVLAVTVGSILLGQRDTTYHLLQEAEKVGGPQVREYLAQVITSSQHRNSGLVASLLSLGVTFFSASNLFLNLDDAVSWIWKIKAKGSFVKNYIVARLIAFFSVVVFGSIMMGWVILDAMILYISKQESGFPGWAIVSYVVSFLFFTVGFTITFSSLPRNQVTYRDALPGAFTSAFLFSTTENLLTYYIARAAGVYTVAAGVVILLLWMYYSTMIYFLGVEITYVYCHRYGSQKDKPAVEAFADDSKS